MKYSYWRDWNERCETCKHYDGKCKLIQIQVGKMDYCKDWAKKDST